MVEGARAHRQLRAVVQVRFRPPSDWRGRSRGDGPLQKCLICSPQSGLIAVDVDREDGYTVPGWPGDAEHPGWPDEYVPGCLGTRTGKLIGRPHAISTRGDRFHILIDARGVPAADWPQQGPIAGGDIKSKGFIPVPGSRHYSGDRYEPVPGGRPVPWWPGLITAINADRADQKERNREERRREGGGPGGGGGGSGGGHDGEVAARVMSDILRGLTKEQCYERWLAYAVPLDPGWLYDAADFERHYGDETRGALAKARAIRAADRQAWQDVCDFLARARGGRS